MSNIDRFETTTWHSKVRMRTSPNGNICNICYCPFVRGIHCSPVDYPRKGTVSGPLMFLCCQSEQTVEQNGNMCIIIGICCYMYSKTSNISCTLVCTRIVDHSDVVGAAPTYIFIPGINGLGKDNCKTRQETCKFQDLVRFILKVLQ